MFFIFEDISVYLKSADYREMEEWLTCDKSTGLGSNTTHQLGDLAVVNTGQVKFLL
jgi:hypothetical protein